MRFKYLEPLVHAKKRRSDLVECLDQKPMAVVRDPAKNARIDLPSERNKKHFRGSFDQFLKMTHVRFSPVVDDLVRLYTAGH